MAAAPPSYESENRRALRLAIGVTITFLLTQTFPWPVSFLATVATLVYLQDAKPPSLSRGFGTVANIFLSCSGGFVLTVLLGDYPLILILTLCGLLVAVYRYAMIGGSHAVTVIGLLLATTLVPVVTNLLPELGYLFIVSLSFSFFLAWLISIALFALMPPLKDVPAEHAHGDIGDVTQIAVNLAVVVGPLVAFFLFTGRTDVLVLVYTAIFVTTVSQTGSAAMGLTYLRANLIFGAGAVIIVFELLTIVPFLPFAVAVFFLAIFVFAKGFFGHGPRAAEWSSGAFGFVIILSGMLSSEKITAVDKLFDRLVQIGLAALYVTFAFALLEYLSQRRTFRRAKA